MGQVWKTEAPPYWAHFGRLLTDFAAIPVGAYVLDIGFGRGTSLLPAADKVGSRGLVVGIDDWPDHVRNTALEIRWRRLHNAKVLRMDARSLGFRSESFDMILSGFAYVFFALEDAISLLRKEGRIVLSSWAWQEDSEWMGEIMTKYLTREVCGDDWEDGPDDPSGRPRVYARDTIESLSQKLTNAGFSDVVVTITSKDFVYRDEDEWWDVMGHSGWQEHLKSVRQSRKGMLERLKQDAFEALSDSKDSSGIHFERSILLASGARSDCLFEATAEGQGEYEESRRG